MKYMAFILLLLSATPATAAIISPPVSVFDTPTQVAHALVQTQQNTNEEVDCFYYPEFMVKQVDAHEKGAAQLSFLPIRPGSIKPECQRANLEGEHVIPPAEWSGYFTGAKEGYAFFDADDGVNGGMGFAVYDGKNGIKRFADTYKGNLQSLTTTAVGLSMKYRRAYTADCSVVSEGDVCWAKIREATHLPEAAQAPDCAASYASVANYLAKARCRGDASPTCVNKERAAIAAQNPDAAPSMIGYAAIATITADHSSILPDTGKATCWPQN